MKLKLLLLALIPLFIFCQTWEETEDIWSGEKIISSEDSVTFNTTDKLIYMYGDETLDILVSTEDNLGAFSIWGYVSDIDSTAADTVFIKAAPFRGAAGGSRDAWHASYTVTWQVMDTVSIADSLGSDYFDIFPMSNTTLKASAASYLAIRFEGITGKNRTFWMKKEEVETK